MDDPKDNYLACGIFVSPNLATRPKELELMRT